MLSSSNSHFAPARSGLALLVLLLVALAGYSLFLARRSAAGPLDLPPPKESTSLLDATGYARPADSVQAPGDVFLPELEGNTAPESPIIYSHSFQGGANESLILKGTGFTASTGSDTKVWLYSQTTAEDAHLQSIPFLQDRSGTMTVEPPAGTPYGMFMLWAENRHGPGRPVRINNAEAWWLRPNRTAAGMHASVFGRNLSHLNGSETGYVYLRPWNAGPSVSSQPLSVVEVNPYRVTFELPAGLAPGAYEVWTHNGHGGDYGWSGPLRLEVVQTANPFASGRRLDVTAYGASPSAGDDTAAIEAAVSAARPGDTLFFPAGRYSLGRPLEIPVSVSIEGEGRDSSILEFANGSGHAGSALRLHGFPARVQRIGIQSHVTTELVAEQSLIFFDGRFQNPSPAGAVVEDVRCELPSGQMYACFRTDSVNEVRVENSEFIAGSAVLLSRSHQVLIRGNTFYGNWPDLAYSPLSAIGASVSAEVEVTNNRAFSRNRAARETLSRFYVAQGHSHGATLNHYIAENKIQDVGCQSETCGENILMESPGTLYFGQAAVIDDTLLKFEGANWKPGSLQQEDPWVYERPEEHHPSIVAIQSGRGEGQYRRIVGNTTDSITIDRPWDVAPDRSSEVAVITPAFHKVIYRNTIQGWPGAVHNPHGLNVGVQAYGSLFDSVIAGNKVSSMSRGIEISTLVNRSCGFTVKGFSLPSDGNNCPNWNVLIADNEISQTRRGITAWVRVEDPPRNVPGTALMNNVIRRNRIVDTEWKAISLGDTNRYPLTGDWQLNTVVESNYIENADVHIELLGSQRDTIIRNNVLNNDRRNSIGIRFEMGVKDAFLYDNQLNGEFDECFSGNVVPGPVQLTERRLRLSAAPYEPAEFREIIRITNAGVLPVRIEPQVEAPWLEARIDSDWLTADQPLAALTLKLQPGLDEGEYATVVTIAPDGAAPVTIGVQVSIKPR